LVYDAEKVRSEDVGPSGATSCLLVDPGRVPPLSLHLHIVCGALFAFGNAILLTLRVILKVSSGLVRRYLSWIVHANLVHSVVALVQAVHLSEYESAKCRVADRITSFMASQSPLECTIDIHFSRKSKSELTQI